MLSETAREQHEEAVRIRFLERGLGDRDRPDRLGPPGVVFRQTRDAIARSVDVIDQAVFLDGDRMGAPTS